MIRYQRAPGRQPIYCAQVASEQRPLDLEILRRSMGRDEARRNVANGLVERLNRPTLYSSIKG